MENIKNVLTGVAYGVRDAIRGVLAIWRLNRAQDLDKNKRSPPPPDELSTLARRRATQVNKPKPPKIEEPRIFHRILQCCTLNGGVFWLSMYIFNYLVLPALDTLTHFIFGSSPSLAVTVWSWMNPMLSYTFGALWVLPLFLLSKIVNSLWFQDIADSAYRQKLGRPLLMPSISKLIADTLFSVLIQALFLVQGMLVSLLPITAIGQLVSLLHMCLLYSLYAFEYKWLNMGWELHKRLSFIENNWPYFVGFGLPLAILTSIPTSYFISGCVFSMLFPLLIISGNEADVVSGSCNYSLRLFSPVVCVSNTIFSRFMGRRQVVGTPTKSSNQTVKRQAMKKNEISYRR